MLEMFKIQIEPLNNKLAKALGMRSVQITESDRAVVVPVMVKVKIGHANYKYIDSGKLRSLKALGLL